MLPLATMTYYLKDNPQKYRDLRWYIEYRHLNLALQDMKS